MVREYIFRGRLRPELVKIKIIARDKIELASRLTNYIFTDITSKFYDNEEEKEKCMQMSKEEFNSKIISEFVKQGYMLVHQTGDI